VYSGKVTDVSGEGQLQNAATVYKTIWRNITDNFNLQTIPTSTADCVKRRHALTFITATLKKTHAMSLFRFFAGVPFVN